MFSTSDKSAKLKIEKKPTSLLRVESLGADSVQLVDEDDRGRLLLRKSERVTHQSAKCAIFIF